jgi:type I restriction enzyme S subunit
LYSVELPADWRWALIGEVTVPVDKDDPSKQPDREFVYLDISSIDNTRNQVVEPKYYRGADAPSRARQVVKANDVLFSTVRTYLRNIALVPEAYEGQIASTGFCVLRGSTDLLGRYLFHYVLTNEFLEEIGKLQRGVSYPAVRDDDVRNQLIPLPPVPVQKQIIDAIETQLTRLDAAETALKRVQTNLRRYRAAVLKAACEGRLVPTDAQLAQAVKCRPSLYQGW